MLTVLPRNLSALDARSDIVVRVESSWLLMPINRHEKGRESNKTRHWFILNSRIDWIRSIHILSVTVNWQVNSSILMSLNHGNTDVLLTNIQELLSSSSWEQQQQQINYAYSFFSENQLICFVSYLTAVSHFLYASRHVVIREERKTTTDDKKQRERGA